MKPLRYMMLLLLLLCMAAQAHAQRSGSRSADELAEQMREAIMAVDGAELMRDADEVVEVDVFGELRYYSRGQASLLLETLLRREIPVTAHIMRKRRTPSAAYVEIRVNAGRENASDWVVRYAVRRGAWRIREVSLVRSDG